MATGQRSGSWKWAGFVLVGALAAGGAWYLKRPGEEAPQYRLATATRGDVVQVVTATGQLNPVVNVQVGSQVSGIIEKLLVDFNSPVKKNQLIAQLDPATYKANLSQSEGELANAQAGRELAALNAARQKSLLADRLVSQADFDKANAELHQAQAMVKIREASLEKTRVDLGRTSILAPIDGVVISRNVDVGQTVAASLSAPILFVIANDLTRMQIDANISEADIGGVEMGQEATFTVDAFPYRTFRAKVIQIRNAPTTVQNVVTYDTVLEVNNADLKLKPGMTANVSVKIAARTNVLKVPNAALRFRPPESAEAKKATTTAGRPGGPGPAAAGAGPSSAGPDMAAASGGGGGGRRGGGGGGRNRGAELSLIKTVYLLNSGTNAVEKAAETLRPATVKTGISDGAFTEVVEGIKEGDEVVVGTLLPQTSPSSAPTANPFGGGGMRRF